MTLFIILGILCVIVYAISFSNRDKSQDYKIDPNLNYKNFTNQEKMTMDLVMALEKMIKKSIDDTMSLGINVQGDIDHMQIIIETYREKTLKDAVKISFNYQLPLNTTSEIINIVCDLSLKQHIK